MDIIAYVDPGTGAALLQLVLAGAVGLAAVVKLKWRSIRRFFGRASADTSESEGTPGSVDEVEVTKLGDG